MEQGLVFARLRIDRSDLFDRETRSIERNGIRFAQLLQTLDFRLRSRTRIERFLIALERRADARSTPSIEQLSLVGSIEQLLMLMLTAQIDARANPRRKILHARKRPIDGHPRTTIEPHPATNHGAILGGYAHLLFGRSAGLS